MNKKILLLLAGCLVLPFSLFAKSYTYQSISDFPNIAAGEIPFYKDKVANRNVLAINAAKEEYRDKFARATRTFDGETGTYDVTIVALGEIDGECIYRLSVDGNIIGIKVNARTDDDYGEQQHVFKDVAIPAGATISVDASAVSNGLIPENGGFAYARGRWRSLTVRTAGEVADNIDLALTINATPENAIEGDTINYSMTVNNLSTDRTASGLSISANLPEELTFGASADCSAEQNKVNCLLPELAPNTANTVNWSAIANSIGTASINATTSADQNDNVTDNNNATSNVIVSAANINTDAGITLVLAKDTLETAEIAVLTATVSNNGSDDLAAVTVEFSADSNLQFSKPLESCVEQDDMLTCTIDSILSNETVVLTSNISSTDIGTYTVQANVLVGNDEVNENNTATTMLDVEQLKTPASTDSNSEKSGSGSAAILLLGLLPIVTFRRKL